LGLGVRTIEKDVVAQPKTKASDVIRELAMDQPHDDLYFRRLIKEYEPLLGQVQWQEAAEICLVLSLASWKLGRDLDALDYATRGVNLNPSTALNVAKAVALLRLGRPAEALEPLFDVADHPETHTDRVIALGNLAEAFFRLGDNEAAFVAFEQAAAEASPESAYEQLGLAIQASEIGLLWEALSYLTKFVSLLRGHDLSVEELASIGSLNADEELIVVRLPALWKLTQELQRNGPEIVRRWKSCPSWHSDRSGNGVLAVYEETRPLRARSNRAVLG
jgi:tetratricopeptide (TPR) repeat protein